jgi:hypothetical protein
MREIWKGIVAVWVTMMALAIVGIAPGVAGEQQSFPGWEKGGAYNKYYKASELDQFKGVVEDIVEIVPMPGMAKGTGLLVRDEGKDLVTVHLGPQGFVDLRAIALKKGDKIKVKGVWAEIAGKDVLMASKIKKGETAELKLRLTKDGTPFWTMAPDELTREQEKD